MILRLFLFTLLFYSMACQNNSNTEASIGEAMADSATPLNEETAIEPATSAAEASQESKIQGAELEAIIRQIRKEYARIEKLIAEEQLEQKELAYECPDEPHGGTFTFYFQEGELLKATQSFYMGDHFGGESSYYFQAEQLFFAFHQNGSWSFAGSDSEEPITRDDFKEQRDYYYQGKLVNQLFKSYSQFSNQEIIPSNQIPNKSTGEDISNKFIAAQIKNFAKQQTVTCEMLN